MGEVKATKATTKVTEAAKKGTIEAAEVTTKEKTAIEVAGKIVKEITREAKVQRNYKDTVSRMLFREPENALSLYNALNGTDYTDASQIIFNIVTFNSSSGSCVGTSNASDNLKIRLSGLLSTPL